MSTKTVGIIAAVVLAVVALPLVLPLLAGSKITMENYNKIRMGMNYEDVSGLLGEGESKSLRQIIDEGDTEMPPMPEGVPLDAIQNMLNLTIYVWKKDENTVITAGFSSGSLVVKGQKGLADKSSYDASGLQQIIRGFTS